VASLTLLVDVFPVANVLEDGLGCHELFGVSVRNLKAEFVFEGHDQLDVIEGIESEVVDKVRLHLHLVGIDFVIKLHNEQNAIVDSFPGEDLLVGIAARLDEVGRRGLK